LRTPIVPYAFLPFLTSAVLVPLLLHTTTFCIPLLGSQFSYILPLRYLLVPRAARFSHTRLPLATTPPFHATPHRTVTPTFLAPATTRAFHYRFATCRLALPHGLRAPHHTPHRLFYARHCAPHCARSRTAPRARTARHCTRYHHAALLLRYGSAPHLPHHHLCRFHTFSRRRLRCAKTPPHASCLRFGSQVLARTRTHCATTTPSAYTRIAYARVGYHIYTRTLLLRRFAFTAAVTCPACTLFTPHWLRTLPAATTRTTRVYHAAALIYPLPGSYLPHFAGSLHLCQLANDCLPPGPPPRMYAHCGCAFYLPPRSAFAPARCRSGSCLATRGSSPARFARISHTTAVPLAAQTARQHLFCCHSCPAATPFLRRRRSAFPPPTAFFRTYLFALAACCLADTSLQDVHTAPHTCRPQRRLPRGSYCLPHASRAYGAGRRYLRRAPRA